jgi:predicted CopG family antitoxin
MITTETVNFMSTIQVEEEVKRQLFSIAAELQSKRGKKTSLNEAIRHLISVYLSQKRDISVMLSLFGCLGSEPKAKALLKELRAEEEERLEALKRECCA